MSQMSLLIDNNRITHSKVIGWFEGWLKCEQSGGKDFVHYLAFKHELFNPGFVRSTREVRRVTKAQRSSPNITREFLHPANNTLELETLNGAIAVSTPVNVDQTDGQRYSCMLAKKDLTGNQTEPNKSSVCYDTLPVDAPQELTGRSGLALSFTVDDLVGQNSAPNARCATGRQFATSQRLFAQSNAL